MGSEKTYAKMPEVAGNRIPNKSWKFSLPFIPVPAAPLVSFGLRFCRKVRQRMPVNSMPRLGDVNGALKIAENGMLKVAIMSIINKALLAFAKSELPARHIAVHITRTAVAHKYCHQKLSGMKFDQLPESMPKTSTKQFMRPRAFIAVLKTNPM